MYKGRKDMNLFMILLMLLLIVCAGSVSFIKSNLSCIIVFSAYSLIMSVIWILMESPDLAITEAAVGAGVTSILFYATLRKINQIDIRFDERKDKEAQEDKNVTKQG